MRRRAVLSALAAGTAGLAGGAGCAALSTDSTTPDPARGVTPFVHDVTVATASPSATSPPAVTVAVRNAADEPHRLATPNYAFPFPTSLGEATTGDAALVLATAAPASRDGCWAGRPRARPMVARRPFGPGEAARRRYAVVNRDGNATCWPPGEYRFTQTYYLDPPADGPATDGARYTWGFTLRVGADARLSVAGTHGPRTQS